MHIKQIFHRCVRRREQITHRCATLGAFHLMTQIDKNVILSKVSDKDRMTLVNRFVNRRYFLYKRSVSIINVYGYVNVIRVSLNIFIVHEIC